MEFQKSDKSYSSLNIHNENNNKKMFLNEENYGTSFEEDHKQNLLPTHIGNTKKIK